MRPDGTHGCKPRHLLLGRAAAAAALAAISLPASAVTKSFIFGGSTNWRDGANWTPGGEPGLADDAFVLNGDPVDRVVNYNTFLPVAPLLASVHIDATGSGTLTLAHAAQTLRANNQYVGEAGTGAYFQSGGTNEAGALYLGFDSGSSGVYTVTNTANLQVMSALYVGVAGTGTFNQFGGNVAVAPGGELSVAYFAGSSGAYAISGGTLDAPTLRIADDAGTVGHFEQSGGAVNVAVEAVIGSFDPTSAGTYNMTGGTLTVGGIPFPALNLIVGDRGSGTFRQSGGTVRITSSGQNGLILGNLGASGPLPASAGSYELSGTAQLFVTGRTTVGLEGDATFTQDGGTHLINGDLVIGPDGTGTSTTVQYLLNGGTLAADNITLYNGAFTRTGGLIAFGSFNQIGGVFNGTLNNTGVYIYNGGTFNGRLVNQAGSSAVFDGDFAAADGIDNFTDVFIDGITVTANGFGLRNNVAGEIQLSGGTIDGAGPILNQGTLSGSGTLGGTGGITNDGDWTVDLGDYRITNTGPLVNNGSITLSQNVETVSLDLDAPGIQLRNNGTILLNPNGAITGSGTLLNRPTGLIEATDATIGVPITNQGTIRIGTLAAGNLHLAGNMTNTGSILLTGPLVSLSGGTVMNNGGTLSGQGQVANPISNAGVIQNNTLAGQLELSGEVTNLPGGQITVGPNAAISINLLSNAGVVNINAGTFTSTNFANSGTVNVVGGTLDSDAISNTGTLAYAPPPAFTPVQSLGPIANQSGGVIQLAPAAQVVFFDAIAHNPGAVIDVAPGATANFLGPVTAGGGGGTGAVTNNGTIIFATNSNAVGEISGGGGTINLSDGTTLATPRLTQDTVNLVALGPSGTMLRVTPAATPGVSTSKVNNLNISGGPIPFARLDLTNTNLIVDYAAGPGPLGTIRSQIQAAYNNGAWNGQGVTSSTAAGAPSNALGYGEASTLLGLSGTATANWNGQTADATSVLIRYTKGGDANLDGTVNFPDLVALAQNYNNTSGAALWSMGDFTYDGNVTFPDLVRLAQNYNTSLPTSAIPGAPAHFQQDLAAAFAHVPEPGPATLLAAAAISLNSRRRSRCRRAKLA